MFPSKCTFSYSIRYHKVARARPTRAVTRICRPMVVNTNCACRCSLDSIHGMSLYSCRRTHLPVSCGWIQWYVFLGNISSLSWQYSTLYTSWRQEVFYSTNRRCHSFRVMDVKVVGHVQFANYRPSCSRSLLNAGTHEKLFCSRTTQLFKSEEDFRL